MSVIATTIAVFSSSAKVGAATIVWDFDTDSDNGASEDGWTNISGTTAASGSGPGKLADGGRTASDGSAAAEDSTHTSVLFRSPAFILDNSGDLTFNLSGGGQNGTLPSSVGDVPLNVDSTGTAGTYGIALRDNDTDAYVLTAQRSTGDNSWEAGAWTAAELVPYVSNGAYTVDFFDYRDGGWGHVSIDDVTVPGSLAVPEPTTTALLGLGGLALILRRRK